METENNSLLVDEVTTEETTNTEVETPAVSNRESMETFISTLPDDIRENKSWEKFNDPSALAGSYLELQKLVGKKGDFVGEDGTPEEFAEMWSKLGKPKSVEDYGIELPEDLRSLEGSFEKSQSVLQLAHDANLTKEQASKLFEGLYAMESEDISAIKAVNDKNLADGEATLREAWGNGFSEMANNVTALEKRLGVFEEFEANGLNANPSILKLLGTLAGELSETSTIETAIASTPVGVEHELEEITAKIKEFMNSGKRIPQHLNDRRSALFEKMN